MNNREELIKHFAELNFKIGAEVGVLAGVFSKFICQTIPGVKLYSIDAWGITDKKEKMLRYHLKMYERAKRNLADCNAELIRKTSIEAAKDFADNSLDFVYIDAAHGIISVREDITAWTPKVRSGGIVSGHDYDWESVSTGVNEYALAHGYKIESTVEENTSWYFTKP